jgi:hypothetical protein
MKLHFPLTIVLLFASALCAFATGAPTITSAAWSDPSPAPKYNTAEPEITIIGNYLDKVESCSLRNAVNNELWPLEVVRSSFARLAVRVPQGTLQRRPIPPGVYKVRLSAGADMVESANNLSLSGVSVTSYTREAPHERPVIRMRVATPNSYQLLLEETQLVDAQGNRWKVAAVHNEGADKVLTWDAVPGAEYDILLAARHGREIRIAWRSSEKFRAFATPIR